MTDNPADFLPLWMVLSAAFGFLIGELCGDYRRHRICLEETNEDLRQRLDQAAAETKPIERALKEQRGLLHDLHRRLLAVSKGLEKRAS